MLDQLLARQRWQNICLTLLTLSIFLLLSLPSDAQFQAERAINPNESLLKTDHFQLYVEHDGQPSTCDVVLFGYQNRKPGRWSSVSDTLLQISPHRRHTLIGHKPNHMFHAESFWPDLLQEKEVRIALRPLSTGLRTDILGIHFQGNGERLHPKSFDVAEELLAWLNANPSVHLRIIGHANGANHSHSRSFYKKISERRAESLIHWLVNHGLDESRFEADGRGADALLFPDPVYAWQHEANRRVEIEILSH